MREIIFSTSNRIILSYNINWSAERRSSYLFFTHDIPALPGVDVFVSYVDENEELVKKNIDAIQIPRLTPSFSLHFEYDFERNNLQQDVSRVFRIQRLFYYETNDINGNTLDSFNIKISSPRNTDPCAEPSGLSFSVENGNMNFTWNESRGGNSYRLRLVRQSNNEESFYQSESNSVMVPLSDLPANAAFRAAVAGSCSRSLLSDYTPDIEFVTPAFTEASDTATPTITNISIGSLQNSIILNIDNSNSNTDSLYYILEYTNETTGENFKLTSRSEKISISDLQWQSRYEFKVKAVYSDSESDFSSSIAYETPVNEFEIPNIKCESPNNLKYEIDDSIMRVYWDLPNRTIMPVRYQYRYRLNSGDEWIMEETTNKEADVFIGENIYAEFQVKTICSTGESVYSPTLIYNANNSTCPTINEIEARAVSPNSIRVSWGASANTNVLIESYTLYFREKNKIWNRAENIDADIYILQNLKPATEYEIFIVTNCFDKVNALNINSINTDPLSVYTLWENSPCGSPVEGTAAVLSPTSIELKWKDAAAPNAPLSYQIYYKPSLSSRFEVIGSSKRNITIDDLLAGTKYDFEVIALCSSGNETVNSEALKLTAQTEPSQVLSCPPPIQLTTRRTEPYSIELEWGYPDLPVSYFELEVQNSISGSSFNIRANKRFALIRNLSPGSEYSIRIRTVCPFGVSEWTGYSTFRTGNIGCLAPIGITIIPNQNNLKCFNYIINLNEDSEESSNYELEYTSGSFRRVESITETEGVTCPVPETPGAVRFRVRSFCGNGVSAWSPYTTPYSLQDCPMAENVIIETNETAQTIAKWTEVLGVEEQYVNRSIVFLDSDFNLNTIDKINAMKRGNLYESNLGSNVNYNLFKVITDCGDELKETPFYLSGRDVRKNTPSFYSAKQMQANQFTIEWLQETNATFSHVQIGYEFSDGRIVWEDWQKLAWNRNRRSLLAFRNEQFRYLRAHIIQQTNSLFYSVYHIKQINNI